MSRRYLTVSNCHPLDSPHTGNRSGNVLTVVITRAHNARPMGYRPPSVEPRGAWAKAIHRKRRELNISQQRAFELLGPSLGFGPKSRAAYVALDLGTRPPTEAESKVLAEWLGGYPDDEPITAGTEGDTPAVPAAYLARIDALLEQMAADRQLIRDLLEALAGRVDPDLAETFRADAAVAERMAGTPRPPRPPDPFEHGGEPRTAHPETRPTVHDPS